MGRLLGIDYGTVRIGLALTDPMQIIASPFKSINGKGDYISELKEIVKENEVEKIILGYPMGLSGNKTQKTLEVDKFCEELKVLGLEVVFWDESFTSVQAHDTIRKLGKKASKNKEKVDPIAASIMLSDYLKSIS